MGNSKAASKAVAWICAIGALLLPAAGFPISFTDKSFDQLVLEADEIFVGIAEAASSRKLPAGAVVTDTTFRDLRTLKGLPGATRTSVMVAGGTVGAETLEIRGVPKFRIGLTYLLFVKGNGSTIFPMVGGYGGLFQVRRDPASGVEQVLDAWGRVVMKTDGTPLTLEEMARAIRDRLGAQ